MKAMNFAMWKLRLPRPSLLNWHKDPKKLREKEEKWEYWERVPLIYMEEDDEGRSYSPYAELESRQGFDWLRRVKCNEYFLPIPLSVQWKNFFLYYFVRAGTCFGITTCFMHFFRVSYMKSVSDSWNYSAIFFWSLLIYLVFVSMVYSAGYCIDPIKIGGHFIPLHCHGAWDGEPWLHELDRIERYFKGRPPKPTPPPLTDEERYYSEKHEIIERMTYIQTRIQIIADVCAQKMREIQRLDATAEAARLAASACKPYEMDEVEKRTLKVRREVVRRGRMFDHAIPIHKKQPLHPPKPKFTVLDEKLTFKEVHKPPLRDLPKGSHCAQKLESCSNRNLWQQYFYLD